MVSAVIVGTALALAVAEAPVAGSEPPALLPGLYNVVDFGAVGDGTHDDTAAFQRALEAAARTGACVYAPPSAAGQGYVLTRTLTLPEGVSLVGAFAGTGTNVRAVFDLPDKHIRGAKIFARPAPDQYQGEKKAPLLRLGAGCTVRGFWILYDEQPMPSDEEFRDPASPYHYASFEEARARFVADHVKPYGPTFYCDGAVNVVIEDITCDRFYDFLYFRTAGKSHLARLALYGYKRAFMLPAAADVLHIDNVEWVPNGGPLSPGGPYNGHTYTWVYGIIVSQPDNVGIHLGQVDGYSFYDVTFFGIHTAVRFGCSPEYPMPDPVNGGQTTTQKPGAGPWGDMTGLRTDQCVVGLHFVWPTHLTNRIANAMVFTGFRDGTTFAATAGPGALEGVGQQAAILVEDTHNVSNNAGFTATCMLTNTLVASFEDSGRFGAASANAATANGRVFLLDGSIFLELSGLQVNAPYHDGLVWAAGPNVGRTLVRARGYILNFVPQPDLTLELPAPPGAAPGKLQPGG